MVIHNILLKIKMQVEHPVTEMISSVDLIEEQIRVAMGEKIQYKQVLEERIQKKKMLYASTSIWICFLDFNLQEDIVLRGHSIEWRINAEDAFKGFRPGPGMCTLCWMLRSCKIIAAIWSSLLLLFWLMLSELFSSQIVFYLYHLNALKV